MPPTSTATKPKGNMPKQTIEVQSDEDGETFVCVGTLDKRKALREIRSHQRDECGMDDEYLATLDNLELTPIWKGPSPESANEEWTYWGDPPVGSRYIGSGWKHSI